MQKTASSSAKGSAQKKINQYLKGSIATSVVLIVLGIIFIFFPTFSLEVIRWIIAIFAMISGIFMIISDLNRHGYSPFFSTMAYGTILAVIGLIFAVYPGVMNIFPIIIGALFVISAVMSLRFAATIKDTGANTIAALLAALSLVCGVLLILNPWGGSISVMIFSGIMMIIYAVSSIANMVVIKRNIKKITKKMKEFAKELDGEEA